MADSTFASQAVVVWEWLNDVNMWMPYSPKVSNHIEGHRPSTDNKVKLGDADDNLENYILDLNKGRQVNTRTGGKRLVRRQIYIGSSAIANSVIWQFEGDDDNWVPYNVSDANILESALCDGLSSVKLAGGKYSVDLEDMIQTREDNETERDVMRSSLRGFYTEDTVTNLWPEFTNIAAPAGNRNQRYQSKSRGKRPRKYRERKSADSRSYQPRCSYMQKCYAFVKALDLSRAILNNKRHRCFCSQCYDGEDYMDYGRPPKQYSVPKGWVRFALNVPSRTYALKAFENWHRAFHGTKIDSVKSILDVGDLAAPGVRVLGGKSIKELPGHFTPDRKPTGFDTKQVFVTPSIHYAKEYAGQGRFNYEDNSYNVQVAFLVLISPDAYTVGPQTIGARGRIDPVIDNDSLEFMTNQMGSTILYGLLIKMN